MRIDSIPSAANIKLNPYSDYLTVIDELMCWWVGQPTDSLDSNHNHHNNRRQQHNSKSTLRCTGKGFTSGYPVSTPEKAKRKRSAFKIEIQIFEKS